LKNRACNSNGRSGFRAASVPTGRPDPNARHAVTGVKKQNRPAGNRLINEKSPYLLQHANNPVDWHPWDDHALALAKKEGKPIFLSVGYSTCHWCHVMAHESFENPAIAALLNKHFINIKVDQLLRAHFK
jgi:hypothetical protein